MTYPAPKKRDPGVQAAIDLLSGGPDPEMVRLRAENAELRAEVERRKKDASADALGRRIAVLVEENAELRELCAQVEQWLGLKVAQRPTHAATDAAERAAKKTIRQHFGPWLKAWRKLRGAR